MSDTPRTDIREFTGFLNAGETAVSSDFARQLERELAEAQADADHWKGECNALQRMVHEAQAEIERKDQLIEQMRDTLKHVRQYSCSHMQRTTHDMIDAALSAAERGE